MASTDIPVQYACIALQLNTTLVYSSMASHSQPILLQVLYSPHTCHACTSVNLYVQYDIVYTRAKIPACVCVHACVVCVHVSRVVLTILYLNL